MEWTNQPYEHQNSPENHEQLRINTIAIPTDDQQPLRLDQISPTSLSDYQRLVSGHIEALPLNNPPGSLYLNDEGKLNQLLRNDRATLLAWIHNKALRYRDVIVGDAFLTGPVDEAGVDTNAAGELISLLTQAQHFRVEVQTVGDPRWYGNLARFDRWTDAYASALDLGWRWTQVEDVRVVAEP